MSLSLNFHNKCKQSTASPRISINDKHFLVPGPTVMGTHVKVFLCDYDLPHISCSHMETDFWFCKFFDIIMTQSENNNVIMKS